jgi:thioredoxin 1
VFLDAEGKEFFRHEGYYPKDEIVKLLKTKGVGK